MATKITPRFASIDGYRKTCHYKTLAAAQKRAWEMVGRHPDVSQTFNYAVSGDGICKVTPSGVSLSDLFPPEPVNYDFPEPVNGIYGN